MIHTNSLSASPEAAAAQQELDTLEKLAQGVSTTIADLVSQRPSFDSKTSLSDFAIHESKYSSLKGYQELALNCYGRTVSGGEVDVDGKDLGNFIYRITQANVGYTADKCAILARNSPFASQLITARLGDEAEIELPNKTRFLTPHEVRTFEGPVSLLSRQLPNFQSMTLRLQNNAQPTVIRNLRVFWERVRNQSEDAALQIRPTEGDLSNLAWLTDWTTISLSDSETVSLGHQFFTQTTPQQENALNEPRGVTFVEGIAGAGKTSVALGRLKFFANFSTGEHLDHYGLKNAPAGDFSPTRMVGFVLSHSLKRYLKETAAALDLERLPIRDFQEFRTSLSNRFGLAQKFKRSKDDASGYRTRLLWLLALDTAMARVAGGRLKTALASASDVTAPVRNTLREIANDLEMATIRADRVRFHLRGLAQRVARDVMNAEFRSRETVIREQINRADFNTRADLRNALDRIRQEEERRSISPFVRRLLESLDVSDIAVAAVHLNDFTSIVYEAFGGPTDQSTIADLNSAIQAVKALLSVGSSEAKRALTDGDLVAMIAISAIIADGFDYPDPPSGLYQIRRNTAVFIDEVQDFTEIEILLMGMTTTEDYNQITLAGDRCQRLQLKGAVDYQNLFPFASRSRQNKQVFLDHNFRQRRELAALSAGFRSTMQADSRVDLLGDGARSVVAAYTFGSQEAMAQLILERIRSVSANATIAVIAPSEVEAQSWHAILQEDLAADHRPALLSHRDDLTRKYEIHFTEVRETKGLEFDVVIVPDIGSFSLDTEVGRNQVYVAISRPKHALLLGCSQGATERAEIKSLVENRLIELTALPARLAN